MYEKNEAEARQDFSQNKNYSDNPSNYRKNTGILQRKFRVTIFSRQSDTDAKNQTITWQQLVERIEQPLIHSQKDGGAVSPTFFEPNYRSNANAVELSMLFFDIDSGNLDLPYLTAELDKLKVCYAFHSTHSHKRIVEKKNPNAESRWRVIIPLENPIPAEKLDNVWNNLNNLLGLNFDTSCNDTARLYFKPSKADAKAIYAYYISDSPELLRWQDYFTHNEEQEQPSNNEKTDVKLDAFLSKLHNVKQTTANQWTACCPSHDDRNPSLSIMKGEKQEIVVFCHSNQGCTFESIFSALGITIPHNNSAQQRIEVFNNEPPIPLPEDNLPAPELDENLLPNEWREWLTDITERMQCPLDYPTVAAIVSASALIGNKIRIRPKQRDTWQVTANLWGAVVGIPSLLKSPAVKEGLFFFREIENDQRKKYEESLLNANFDKEFAEAKQAELKKLMRKLGADKEDLRKQFQECDVEEPKENRLSTNDATIEKLGELFNENPNGILQLRDELTGWLRGLDRPGREQDRAFYLECWDGGESSTVDRIGRGKIYVKNSTLSILGTIQPAMLLPYLRGSLEGYGDDGLIQRLQMLVYPNKPETYRYIDRLPKGRDKARNSFKAIYDLDPAKIKAKQLADEFGGGYFVQFDDAAQDFFQYWMTELETALRSDTFDTTALESHVAKYRSLMPSLALIFHLLDCVSNKQSDAVSLKNAQMAAAWCSYLQLHAARLYQMAILSEFDVAREIIKRIQSKSLDGEFTARDIYSRHWSKLTKPKEVQNGLEILVEYGHLTAVTINEGHRPKTVYFIHGSLK